VAVGHSGSPKPGDDRPALLDCVGVGVDHRAQRVAIGIDVVEGLGQMIGDVGEIRTEILAGAGDRCDLVDRAIEHLPLDRERPVQRTQRPAEDSHPVTFARPGTGEGRLRDEIDSAGNGLELHYENLQIAGTVFVAFTSVSCTFLAEIHACDTLYPQLEITDLAPQGDAGQLTSARKTT
jgi:hypothetical protein